jgi:chromosomal replication initiation ATPase DnaA
MNKAINIAKQINKVANVDVFENTRKREVVEARSLLSFILYKYEKMTLQQIGNLFKDKGRAGNHTTVLHAIKSFETHKKYNSKIQEWLLDITIKLKNSDAKKEFIKHKVNFLDTEDVEKIAKQVDKMTQNK